MGIGDKWPSETVRYTDPGTGAEITRLTGFRANHNHLYFTNNSYYDRNSKIVVCGDRGNAENYFSVDLTDGTIMQLTDLPVLPYPDHYRLYEGIVDPVRNACYFFAGRVLYRLDLMTCGLLTLYTLPEGWRHHVVTCSYGADCIYTSVYEYPWDDPGKTLTDIWNAHTLSRILRIAADGSSAEVIREEHNFIAHVNAAPTEPSRLTFCHEGSWNRVDHRIWGMDVNSREVWKIHEIPEGDNQGHEYWYADGARLGFHGTRASGERYMGRIGWDGKNCVETAFPYNTGHIFSLGEHLVVGDGGADGRYIRVWPWDGTKYEEGRALCGHFSTFKEQASHVHPRFSPDGKRILYTSDCTGYNQVYLVTLPDDVHSLPLLSSLSPL